MAYPSPSLSHPPFYVCTSFSFVGNRHANPHPCEQPIDGVLPVYIHTCAAVMQEREGKVREENIGGSVFAVGRFGVVWVAFLVQVLFRESLPCMHHCMPRLTWVVPS